MIPVAAYVPRRRRDPRGRVPHPSGAMSVSAVAVARAAGPDASARSAIRLEELIDHSAPPVLPIAPAARGVLLVALYGQPESETTAWKRRVRSRDMIMPQSPADGTPFAAAAEAMRIAYEEGAHLLWLGASSCRTDVAAADLLRAAEGNPELAVSAGGEAALVNHAFLRIARRVLLRVVRVGSRSPGGRHPFGQEYCAALVRLGSSPAGALEGFADHEEPAEARTESAAISGRVAGAAAMQRFGGAPRASAAVPEVAHPMRSFREGLRAMAGAGGAAQPQWSVTPN
jgi:hypothetical protein